MQTDPIPSTPELAAVAQPTLPKCGIVMPMSANADYSEEHWNHMREIICDAAQQAGFAARIVSTSEHAAILQNNIMNNIYHDDILVCDLSSRNPNVMLELGLRIAFGKPFVIIKDTQTPFTSDINPIIQLQYDKGMLYPRIKEFKKSLALAIQHTAEESKLPGHQSFLDTFRIKNLKIETLDPKDIGVKEYLEQILTVLNRPIKNDFLIDSEIKYYPAAFTNYPFIYNLVIQYSKTISAGLITRKVYDEGLNRIINSNLSKVASTIFPTSEHELSELGFALMTAHRIANNFINQLNNFDFFKKE